MDLKSARNVHIIGIKGQGTTALAQFLGAQGIRITGSDTEEKFTTDAILSAAGIPFVEHFAPENIPPDVDAVIYSTAYNEENNAEMRAAKARGMRLLSYPEALGEILSTKVGLAVCGTHGKTTTTALLGTALEMAGADPTVIVGSAVPQWNGNARIGKGEYMLIEADEYQDKLRFYAPWGAVLTSADWDHPDFFKNFASYKETFKRFVSRIPKAGFLAVWGDSVDTQEVAEDASCKVLTYGFGEDNGYSIKGHRLEKDPAEGVGAKQVFEVVCQEDSLGFFETKLSGKHNVLNAAAAIAVCHHMGLDMEKVRLAISVFAGTARRFEYVGKRKGSILIDDFAHHPEEIRATLAGARAMFEKKRIVVVFHPHTFTRTKALLEEFAQSFDDADLVYVLDIYGSARETQGGVSSQDLVRLINRFIPNKAEHVPTVLEAVEVLEKILGEGDVLITMGAGNVWEISHKLKD